MQEQSGAKEEWNCKLFSSYRLAIFLVIRGNSPEMQEESGAKAGRICKLFSLISFTSGGMLGVI